MNSRRFDAFTRTFATRVSRRSALRAAASGGVAGLALTIDAGSTLAQTASPVASPAPSRAVEMLFIQSFDSGSLIRTSSGSDAFTLTLEGVAATTAYFSERPERIAGLVDTSDFIDDRVFSPTDPPNAALGAMMEHGQEVVIVELRAPRYDPGAGTVTYEARPIADYQREGLAFFARMQTDRLLDDTFSAGSLFVDQVACQPAGSFAGRCSDCCSSPNCAVGNEGIGYECL